MSRVIIRASLVLLLPFLLLTGVAFGQGGAVAKKGDATTLKDALKEMLQAEGATKMTKVDVTVDASAAATLKEKYSIEGEGAYSVFKGLDNAGTLIGSVVIVNEQGKEGPLQCLVALRPDGAIYDIGFTIFGEDKGKPANSWSFLKQFMGKTSGDPITLGRDVDGVSGATWTSTSVSNAVKRGAAIYDHYVKDAG